MNIKYKTYHLVIRFRAPVYFDTFPLFAIRSVLGMQLRRLVCLFPRKQCVACDLRKQCAYSWLFETPISKENSALSGRDRAPHPFVLSSDAFLHDRTDRMVLSVTVIGPAIAYFPYIYYALSKAGEQGLLRNRTPFSVENVLCAGQSVLNKDGTLDLSEPVQEWVLGAAGTPVERTVNLAFDTPFRLKKAGHFTAVFSYADVIVSAARRANILSALYGEYEQGTEVADVAEPSSVSRRLFWTDLTYYSGRQKRAMKMGGAVGAMDVHGKMSEREVSLLKAAELFHIGKNVSFGLGKVSVAFDKEVRGK